MPARIIKRPMTMKMIAPATPQSQLLSSSKPTPRNIVPKIRLPITGRRCSGINNRMSPQRIRIAPTPAIMIAHQLPSLHHLNVSGPQPVVFPRSTNPAQINIAAQQPAFIGSRRHFSSHSFSLRDFSSFSPRFSSSFSSFS